jgi:hypothetical protein
MKICPLILTRSRRYRERQSSGKNVNVLDDANGDSESEIFQRLFFYPKGLDIPGTATSGRDRLISA